MLARPEARLADPAQDRLDAWTTLLDRLELDVIRSERAAHGWESALELAPWDVPEDYGPVPRQLRERACALLERQRAVAAAVREVLGLTTQHRALLEGVERVTPRSSGQPLYLDVSA